MLVLLFLGKVMKIVIFIVLIVCVVGLIFLLRQSKKMLDATVKAQAKIPSKPQRQLHPEIVKAQKKTNRTE